MDIISDEEKPVIPVRAVQRRVGDCSVTIDLEWKIQNHPDLNALELELCESGRCNTENIDSYATKHSVSVSCYADVKVTVTAVFGSWVNQVRRSATLFEGKTLIGKPTASILLPPRLKNNELTISWLPPTHEGGPNVSYEVHVRGMKRDLSDHREMR